MRAISAAVDIAATPRQVWAVLADLDAYPQWNPFIRSASGQLAEGATLTLRLVPAQGRAMTFRPKVLAGQAQPAARRARNSAMIGPQPRHRTADPRRSAAVVRLPMNTE